jgi:hypothetical protein
MQVDLDSQIVSDCSVTIYYGSGQLRDSEAVEDKLKLRYCT